MASVSRLARTLRLLQLSRMADSLPYDSLVGSTAPHSNLANSTLLPSSKPPRDLTASIWVAVTARLTSKAYLTTEPIWAYG